MQFLGMPGMPGMPYSWTRQSSGYFDETARTLFRWVPVFCDQLRICVAWKGPSSPLVERTDIETKKAGLNERQPVIPRKFPGGFLSHTHLAFELVCV
jgi:hypothetical protein